jgi:hypothetical protein
VLRLRLRLLAHCRVGSHFLRLILVSAIRLSARSVEAPHAESFDRHATRPVRGERVARNLLPSLLRARAESSARKERYMRNAKLISSSLSTAMLLLAGLLGCTRGQNGANDIADEVGKALDPTPEYVDRPAEEPQKPR